MIDSKVAIPACEAAVKIDPGIGRYQYELGRAMAAADRHSEALLAYQRAADLDYPMAWAVIGAIHEDAESPNHDATAAKQAFEKAAKAGVSFARFHLAHQLWFGDNESDKHRALELWEQAEDFTAEKWLGDIYAEGKGSIAPKDEAKALYHYIRAGALVPQDFPDRFEIISARGSAVRAYALKFGLGAAADKAIKGLASLEAKKSE